MKKLRVFLSIALLAGGTLQAQTTGDAAIQTMKTAKSNNWQNWAFAGSMLLTAAGAVFVVSMHSGNVAQSSSH